MGAMTSAGVSDPLATLQSTYGAAMKDYLAGGGEVALSEAYEIGRQALSHGFGILDVIAIHNGVLEALLLRASAENRSRLAREAGDFCRELLSPFEMGLRGYRQANDHLQKLNEALLQQKRALEFANEDLESFSYCVSHDLRAPLRTIDGFGQALLEDAADKLDEQSKRYLGYVRESAQKMAALIDGLLELARVSRGDLVRSRVDLTEMARELVERLVGFEPERKVDVVIEDGLVAEGDAHLVELVLENLIGNAWKFTAKRARARIEVGRHNEGGRAIFHVSDDGAGFDMAYANKLFGVFQRLHSVKEFEGTGIGLATVQRIVRRHGGEAWAEGEVGRGATFYFTLEGKKP
jgi:light-regulated signal transduction histidine kinase (bacteriophytochrome)